MITLTRRVPSRLATTSDWVITSRPSRGAASRANCSTVEPTLMNITRASAVRSAARIAIWRFSWAWCSIRALCVTSNAPPERTTLRGGAAVGAADEAVPVQAAQVAADGHLGDPELPRQAADFDRLVRRDPLQHLHAPFDRQHPLSLMCYPVLITSW